MGFHLITLLVISFLLCLSVEPYVRADVYTVGDQYGWVAGTNYLLWSEKYNFTVGDVLVFNYVKGQHNVYQVSEETYRTCDTSSGVNQTYTSGGDRVNLTEAAKYWFICNIKGHCQGGMKLGVIVASTTSSSGRGNGTADPEFTQPPPPVVVPANSAAVAGGWMGWWGCRVVAFGLLMLMTC